MKSITGQSIMLIYCLLTVLLVPVEKWFVIAFLSVIVYVSIVEIGQSRNIYLAATGLYLAASLVKPQFLLFSPLVFYQMLEYETYFFGVVLGGMYIFFYKDENLKVVAVLMFGFLISGFIWYLISSYRKLWKQFWEMRDTGAELNQLLAEKNKTLLKKQDDEIYTATLKERNRIAREIHDNVGHMLSRSILMVGAMKAVNCEETLKRTLCQLEDTLNTAMTNIRESVHDLHDDSVNLKEALESLVREYTFCKCSLKFDMSYTVPREVKYSFISIVKEALNNVAKHSNAENVKIVAREHPGLYQLVIEDDGSRECVRDMENIISVSQGIGIRNMKDRIQALGGTIQIQEKKGFRIYITAPKKEGTV